MKIEILKDMTIEGTTEDLTKALDKYIDDFNSGKVSTKIGWIEPTYIGKAFGRSTYEGTFEIKSVYKEDNRYYFETDSEEVKNRVENEFYKSGKRVFYDRTSKDLVIQSIDIVGTEESYRYNKYKRLYSLSMTWFSDKVTLDIFEIYRQFHIDPIRYYEIKFGDRLVYRGSELESILDRRYRYFLNFLYVPVRILKYKFDKEPKSFLIEDEFIYKFPTSKFIDYARDESLKHNIVFDTKDKYTIKDKDNEEIAILVYNEFGTNNRRYAKYRISDGKILSNHESRYTIFSKRDVILPIKEYFEISEELDRLGESSYTKPSSLHYLDKVTNSQLEAGYRIHDILSEEISPWSSHAVTDVFKNLNINSTFLDFYDRYKVIIDYNNGKEYKGAVLADINYGNNPNSVVVEFFVDDKDTTYNGEEFIRLFVTTDGEMFYKLDNYNKLGINAILIKEENGFKTFVTNGKGEDISKYFLVAKGKYRDDISLYVNLNNDLNSFYSDFGIIDKLEEHRIFVNNALDDFNKFKYEYEKRMSLLEMSEDELIEHFKLNDMEADEFKKVYPYISKIKFY